MTKTFPDFSESLFPWVFMPEVRCPTGSDEDGKGWMTREEGQKDQDGGFWLKGERRGESVVLRHNVST